MSKKLQEKATELFGWIFELVKLKINYLSTVFCNVGTSNKACSGSRVLGVK